jgi:very-short-patch-repair endonuclease
MAAARSIIVGQPVDPTKAARAKELRQEMTDAERLLWEHLRRNQLQGLHFRRQQVIDGFIVDFHCHRKGLVVELDGAIHQKQQSYDTQRDRVMRQHTLRVLRFANHEVTSNLARVLQRIAAACKT